MLQAVFNVVSPVPSSSAFGHQHTYKHGKNVLAGPAGEHLHWCVDLDLPSAYTLKGALMSLRRLLSSWFCCHDIT